MSEWVSGWMGDTPQTVMTVLTKKQVESQMRIVANVTTDSREKYLPVVKIFPDFVVVVCFLGQFATLGMIAINDIKDGIKIKRN